MKKRVSTLIGALIVLLSFNSCAKSEQANVSVDGKIDQNIKATLTFATWDNEAVLLYDELDIEGKFQEKYPNVSIEIEEFKDDEEYFNSMRIRMSADELPDVMFVPPKRFSVFKEYMSDLSSLEATKNNRLAEGYRMDGKIIGIPEKLGGDYVFYWKDSFENAGVSVPTTWDEFVTTADTLQKTYGATDENYMAIAMGAKDGWPMYPLMEYGPASFSGTGAYWDHMASVDEPFAEGEPIRDAYTKIHDLLSKGVLGKDPLGIGYDQALSLFLNKRAGMMIDSSLGLAKIKNSGIDLTELRSFYLPFTSADGVFNHGVQGSFFLGVPNTSKNVALAHEFVEFYFAEIYPDYITRLSSESTMSNVSKDKDPVMVYADENAEGMELVMYKAGGDDFTAITSEIKFDYNKLGGEMLMSGFDLDARFNEINAQWKAARSKLGIK